MYILYNLLLTLVFFISFPYLLLRALIGKHGIGERMGRLPTSKIANLLSQKVIWFHAASMGEVKALSTIVPLLKKHSPEYVPVISTLTRSGKGEAERTLKDAGMVFFLPLDLRVFVKKALKTLRPVALILVETELWPNLIREAKRSGCFVALINGRISSRSFKRYLLSKGLFRRVLSHLDLLCMQSEEHRERIQLLGAEPNKVKVLGNLKFDRLSSAGTTKDKKSMRELLRIPDHWKVIIGGSTRSGEERVLIEVFKKLKEIYSQLLLILAPRHLDRLKQVERIISNSGLGFIKRSQLESGSFRDLSGGKTPEVILLDTWGELSEIYVVADVAFVGGSLVPIGGHNLLEPAIYGIPVLFGPFVDHFQQEAKILTKSGGGIMVKDQEELFFHLSTLLFDEEKRKKLGAKAREALRKKTGVSAKTVELIFSFLEKNHGKIT